MAGRFYPCVVTGNALLEGDVIYLAEDDGWTRDLARAEVLTDEAHAQLRLLEAQARTAEIVGAYLAAVAPAPDGPRPIHFREAFRARGPSNHCHGKQADRL